MCVPAFDTALGWRGLEDAPERTRREIGQCFGIHKDIEDEAVTVEGWEGRAAAERTVEGGRRRE